jgi:hypothetical protein
MRLDCLCNGGAEVANGGMEMVVYQRLRVDCEVEVPTNTGGDLSGSPPMTVVMTGVKMIDLVDTVVITVRPVRLTTTTPYSSPGVKVGVGSAVLRDMITTAGVVEL